MLGPFTGLRQILHGTRKLLAAGLFLWQLSAVISLGAPPVSNPVPYLNDPVVPTAIYPGGGAFTLSVTGTGFTVEGTASDTSVYNYLIIG